MFERVTISLLFLVTFLGCGSMYPSDKYESDVDTDVGLGSTYDGDDAGQVQGDPCSEDNPWDCDPVTNAGCADAGVELGCGYYAETLEDGGVSSFGFYCLTDSTETAGSACDQENGPWCAGGATCVSGMCVAYCCEQTDCEVTESCTQGDWPGLESPLGYCQP